MGKKLLQKAGLIQLPALPSASDDRGAARPGRVPAEASSGQPRTQGDAAVAPVAADAAALGAGGGEWADGGPAAAVDGSGRSGGVSGDRLGRPEGGVAWSGAAAAGSAVGDGSAGGRQAPEHGAAERAGAARARTAPGTMLGFMSAQSAAIQEAEQLREQLARFDGALPAKHIDPALVRPSRWANRHASAYLDLAFESLKAEIAQSGGNVQPIKVRPVAGVGPSNPAGGAVGVAAVYEIVFGHRRHRACLELGLPVLAVVEALSDQDLFVQMERENRSRQDLSAWEQGMMYARALDLGLYPSNRQLSLAIGRDLGDVGKALSLARLPAVVIEAFASPADLQFRWAKPLSDAQQKDPDALLARAQALRGVAGQLQARQIFDRLVLGEPEAKGVGPSNPAPGERVLTHAGQRVGSIRVDSRGRVTVRFDQPLTEDQLARLDVAIGGVLSLPKR